LKNEKANMDTNGTDAEKQAAQQALDDHKATKDDIVSAFNDA